LGERPSRRQRVILLAGVVATAGLGLLLAFASHPARAVLTDTTTAATTTATTTATTPTTTLVAPTPDPAPTPAPAPKPAPKAKTTPKKTTTAKTPTYHAPAVTPTAPATPPTHVSSAPVRGSATATPKKLAHPSHPRAHVKKKTVTPLVAATKKTARPAAVTTSAPPVTTAKKLPPAVAALLDPTKNAAAESQIGRTALASSTSGGNIGGILLLAGFALGALLITLAVVIPAGATRFAFPEMVIEHNVDLAVLGIALAALTGLVYVLEAAGK
jgi:hypothetical protein